jgi:hypothetical protein
MPGSDEAMKVNPRATPSDDVAKLTERRSRLAEPLVARTPDAVRLSGDLKLADEAVRAASVSTDVRADLVARARALLQSGELDRDVAGLADRIIDSLLDIRSPRD